MQNLWGIRMRGTTFSEICWLGELNFLTIGPWLFPFLDVPDCEDYTAYNGHCYKFIDIQRTYAAAQAFCQSEGGYVVEVGDYLEQNFIEGRTEKNRTSAILG